MKPVTFAYGIDVGRVTDIWRGPSRLIEMALSPVATTADKMRLLTLRRRALQGNLKDLYERTRDRSHFAAERPRFFIAYRRTLLQAILRRRLFRPRARRIAPRVRQLLDRQVELESGERLRARALVVATDGREAARLLGRDVAVETRGTTCFYFAAERPPLPGPNRALNGHGHGLINSLLVPSNLSDYYAPAGQHLVTVNLLDIRSDPDLVEPQLRKELVRWFGSDAERWERLAVYTSHIGGVTDISNSYASRRSNIGCRCRLNHTRAARGPD